MTMTMDFPAETSALPKGSLVAALGLDDNFRPREPRSIEETGLTEALIEAMILKFVLAVGSESGRGLSDRLHLPYGILEATFQSLRSRQLITPSASAPLGDYRYTLSENGRRLAQSGIRPGSQAARRSRRHRAQCSGDGGQGSGDARASAPSGGFEVV